MLLFSKLNKIFFGYFDPENILLDNEKKIFRGELTDISARKEALLVQLAAFSSLHPQFDFLPARVVSWV